MAAAEYQFEFAKQAEAGRRPRSPAYEVDAETNERTLVEDLEGYFNCNPKRLFEELALIVVR